MKITCRLAKYQYSKDGKATLLDEFDDEEYLAKQGIKVDYELQIITIKKNEYGEVTILKKSDKFKLRDSETFTNIHFQGVSYTFRHRTADIYCLTLVQKV